MEKMESKKFSCVGSTQFGRNVTIESYLASHFDMTRIRARGKKISFKNQKFMNNLIENENLIFATKHKPQIRGHCN